MDMALTKCKAPDSRAFVPGVSHCFGNEATAISENKSVGCIRNCADIKITPAPGATVNSSTASGTAAASSGADAKAQVALPRKAAILAPSAMPSSASPTSAPTTGGALEAAKVVTLAADLPISRTGDPLHAGGASSVQTTVDMYEQCGGEYGGERCSANANGRPRCKDASWDWVKCKAGCTCDRVNASYFQCSGSC